MSDAQAAAAPAKRGKSKFVLLLAALLLVGGGGAGGAWFFLHNKGGDGEEPHAEAKSSAKPIFLTLEPFTVNLQDPRGERFAQVGLTLQFEDPKVEMDLKDRLPAVRNRILLLISSKEIEELLTVQGKQRLAEQIRLEAGRALGLDLPDLPPVQVVAAAQAASAQQPASAPAKAHAEVQPEDEDDEAPRPKKKARRKAVVVNPISQVLFSQFIVQ